MNSKVRFGQTIFMGVIVILIFWKLEYDFPGVKD